MSARDECRAAAGDVDELADHLGIDPGGELLEVHVDVVDAGADLGGDEVAEVLGRQVLQVTLRRDERAAGLRHLLAVHGQEAVDVHAVRLAEARALQRGRPEQRVEIEDVLADEVVQLGVAARPPVGVEVQAFTRAQVGETRHVADRRIEPDVEVLAGRAGDLEAEVGRIARHVPVPQPGLEPLVELVGHRLVQGAGARPFAQHRLEVAELEEQVLRLALDRARARQHRDGILEVGGGVGRPAGLAAVAVLVGGAAARAGALDVAVRQEHPGLLVVGLGDLAPGDMAGLVERLEDQLGVVAVFRRVRRVVVVEADAEGREALPPLGPHPGDQLLGADALGPGLQHDRGAVRVVGADVEALVAAQALEAHPDVGLHHLGHPAEVGGAVGIGQGAGDEDLAGHGRLPLSSRPLCHHGDPRAAPAGPARRQSKSLTCSNLVLLMAFS